MVAHDSYWPKSFAISCIAHFFVLSSLGLLAGTLPERHAREEYLVIDLSAVNMVNGGGSSSGGQTILSQPQMPPGSSQTSTAKPASAPSLNSAPLPADQSQPLPSVAGDIKTADSRLPTTNVGTGIGGEAAGTAADSGATTDTNGAIGSGSGYGSGYGNGTGTGNGSGIGSGTGPGIDSAILDFLAEVEKRKDYPYIARKRGFEGVVTLIVELSAAGELNRVQIAQSSGFSQLDDAAASVIRRVCPFPHGLGRPVGMKIPISYRLIP